MRANDGLIDLKRVVSVLRLPGRFGAIVGLVDSFKLVPLSLLYLKVPTRRVLGGRLLGVILRRVSLGEIGCRVI